MDGDKVQRSLKKVEAFWASGLKASIWAEANGVPLNELSSWCFHARRWQTRLNSVPAATSVSTPTPNAGGFVAARLPAAKAAAVRIEIHAGSTRLELHWPVANARVFAAWLREVGR